VRSGGQDAGTATPHHITRHAHPKARPEPLPGDDAPRATGIDYIALIGEQHDRQRERPVNYHALMPPAGSHGNPPAPGEQGQDQDGRGAGEEDSRG
jgi:putative transposase